MAKPTIHELEDILEDHTPIAIQIQQDGSITTEVDLADEVKRLREAGEKICEGFNEGVFVRSTKGDDDSAWAMKLLPYIAALAVFSKGE